MMVTRLSTTADSAWAYAVSVDGVVIARGSKRAMEKIRKRTPGSTLWGLTRTKIGEPIK